jgi:hypothetical protein
MYRRVADSENSRLTEVPVASPENPAECSDNRFMLVSQFKYAEFYEYSTQ